MTNIKRVVDARRTQGRLLYHLHCGHVVATKEPILDSVNNELGVGDRLLCSNNECSSQHEDAAVQEHPRFAEHWSRCYNSHLRNNPTAYGKQLSSLADSDLEEYRKRFP